MKAISEHNAYGAAATNMAYQIPNHSAEQLFAFKAPRLFDWKSPHIPSPMPLNLDDDDEALMLFTGLGWLLLCDETHNSFAQVGVSDACWLMLEKHLHCHKWEMCAFNQATLLDGRWLLGGASRVSSPSWHSILEVDEYKQEFFLQSTLPAGPCMISFYRRVFSVRMLNLKSCHTLKSQGILRVHAVSLQRAGSKTVVRLGLAEWNQEVEICCFLAWVKLHDQFSAFSFELQTKQTDSMVQNQS